MENINELVGSQTTNNIEEETQNVDEETKVDETKEDSSEDLAKELELKNKQLYERAKKAELKAKELEALLHIKEESKNKQDKVEENNPVEFIKMAQVLKDYSLEEIDLLGKQAKAMGITLIEATKDEDTQLLIQAKREKLKKEQTNPLPTNTQSGNDKTYADWTQEDIKKRTSNPTPENIEELNKYNQWARTRQ